MSDWTLAHQLIIEVWCAFLFIKGGATVINSRLLKAKIVLSGYGMSEIAQSLGISKSSLWRKIYGKTEFKQNELLTLSKLLGISNISDIFL